MRSMTGYGESAAANTRYAATVSVRAVNHRFLDVQVRLAEEARASEAALRELVAQEVARGRLELRVDVRPVGERKVQVELNRGVVEAVYAAFHQLVEQGLIASGLAAGDLLRLPEVLRIDLGAGAWSEEDQEVVLGAAREALAQLVASREREGASLAATLSERLATLEQVAGRLDALRGPVREEMAAALSRRVAELLGAPPVDPARLAQEVALLVDRSDVSEELDRLRAHVGHFRELISEAGPTGKRLDFLTQEVFRELNTLGAKCRNAEMTRAVLDGKVLCEQLREQVQNVE